MERFGIYQNDGIRAIMWWGTFLLMHSFNQVDLLCYWQWFAVIQLMEWGLETFTEHWPIWTKKTDLSWLIEPGYGK